MLAVKIEELLQSRGCGMAGKAQMADAALLLLLKEILHKAVFGMTVVAHGIFVYVVQQIKVKVVHAAALQLFFENILRQQGFYAGDVLVTRELVGQVPAFPGITPERLAQRTLGQAAVIGMGGIVVVDAGRHGRVHHAFKLRLVDAAVGEQRQAHGAEAESGEFFVLEIIV